MTRDDERRIEDQIQEELLAQWDADHEEAGDLGDLLVLLVMFILTIALVSLVVVGWFVTGDQRFGWALGLVLAGVVGGYSYLFRKPVAR